MPARAPSPTELLVAWSRGDASAFDRLVPLVEDELKRLARRYMRQERRGHRLQPTALVNEAYLRLVDLKLVRWQSRVHFFAMAARLMRRILVDHARSRDAMKRGGEAVRVPIEEAFDVACTPEHDLVSIDRALSRLEAIHPRKATVVELRFFGALSIEETAEALKISTDTVKRDWRFAKLWLLRELTGGGGSDGESRNGN
jgi:RNA polymerase sigma factor (TIGR02999 family)